MTFILTLKPYVKLDRCPDAVIHTCILITSPQNKNLRHYPHKQHTIFVSGHRFGTGRPVGATMLCHMAFQCKKTPYTCQIALFPQKRHFLQFWGLRGLYLQTDTCPNFNSKLALFWVKMYHIFGQNTLFTPTKMHFFRRYLQRGHMRRAKSNEN